MKNVVLLEDEDIIFVNKMFNALQKEHQRDKAAKRPSLISDDDYEQLRYGIMAMRKIKNNEEIEKLQKQVKTLNHLVSSNNLI